MKLLTQEVLDRLPSNDDTAELGIDDLTVQVKFFNPTGAATWYVYSYDPDSGIGYGLCDLGMGYPELGAVSIPELQAFKGMFGLGIERDIHFKPTALSTLMEKVGA